MKTYNLIEICEGDVLEHLHEVDIYAAAKYLNDNWHELTNWILDKEPDRKLLLHTLQDEIKPSEHIIELILDEINHNWWTLQLVAAH